MKSKLTPRILAMTAGVIITLGFSPTTTFAQGTAFTYQGRLNSGASVANGTYDMRFAIYDTLTLGTQQGSLLTNAATAVSNGLFMVTLDFGNQFPGTNRWLEIGVRTNGNGTFTTLAPRQPLTPTPYAVYSATAGSAGSVSATNITGTVTDARLSANVALRAGGNAFTGNQTVAGGSLEMRGSGPDDAALITAGNSDFSHLLVIFPGRLNDPNPFILWQDGDPLRFATDNSGFSEWMRITSSGNVGIGTTAPSTKLEVAGTVKATAFSGDGANMTNVSATSLGGISIAGFWKTNGNAGANPTSGAFIGTTDNLPLEFRVNGSRALRLAPTPNIDTVNVIGGSAHNFVGVSTVGATIGGGGGSDYLHYNYTNSVEGDFSTASGGAGNAIQIAATFAAIGGGYYNTIEVLANQATIGGGWLNLIRTRAVSATIGGGGRNEIQSGSDAATIGGGDENIIYPGDSCATIGGGTLNKILTNTSHATISGGSFNTIQTNSYAATIGGGDQNTAGGNYATVPGGVGNQAMGQFSFAAGHDAKALHDGTFVWADSPAGGFSSTGNNQFLIRSAGGVGINNNNPNGAALAVNGNVTVEGIIYANGFSAASTTTPEIITPKISTAGNVPLEFYVNGQRALRLEPTVSQDTVNVIGGSALNFVGNGVVGATIGGGGGSDFYVGATINSVEADFGTVSGGANNMIRFASELATIGGGYGNSIQTGADEATIGGGYANTIQTTAYSATIGGGGLNEIQFGAETATISGGSQNTIQTNAGYATIGGGFLNKILTNAARATIGGGDQNTAGANYATVPGGVGNAAGGQFSFAAGHDAKALHDGAFVWADSPGGGFSSTGNNQFCIRARGGVQIDPLTSQFFGAQTRQMLNLYGATYGIGVQADSLYFRSANSDANSGFIWFKGGVHNDGYANAGGGTEMMHLVAGGLYVNGTFVSSSDRNAKENFAPVQPRDVLEKVVALPLTSWSYKADTGTRHVGPMAQDFYAAFNVGPDDKHIATVDADGVALAAIQGLNQKLEADAKAKDVEIDSLKQNLAALQKIVQSLVEKK